MTDDLAKDYLHGQLRSTRQALVWKRDGLPEYDVRRPLTAPGADLWVTPDETREQIIDCYVLQDTTRHAGRSDPHRPVGGAVRKLDLGEARP